MKKLLFILSIALAGVCNLLSFAEKSNTSSFLETKALVMSKVTSDSKIGSSIGTVDVQRYSDSGLELENFDNATYVAKISDKTYIGFELGGNWRYNEETDESFFVEGFAEVVAIDSSEGDIVIPDSIKTATGTYPVTTIKTSYSLIDYDVKQVTLPETIEIIDGSWLPVEWNLEAIYMLGTAPSVTRDAFFL